MLDVLQTAALGLGLAEERAATAAHNIVTAPHSVAEPAAEAAGGEGQTPAAVTGPGSSQFNADGQAFSSTADADLARNLVELQLAEHAYKANAAVIRAANESFQHLLDSFA